jgi:hypothetical protein
VSDVMHRSGSLVRPYAHGASAVHPFRRRIDVRETIETLGELHDIISTLLLLMPLPTSIFSHGPSGQTIRPRALSHGLALRIESVVQST